MKHIKYLFVVFAGASLMDVTASNGKCISPEMSISYKIVDDEGVPVPNVKCRGWIRRFDLNEGGFAYSLLSDTNGVVTIAGKCSVSFTAFFTKGGFYMSRLEPSLDADGTGSAIRDGRWQPYGEMRTVVLKRIKNPIEIGRPGRFSIPIPAYDKWIGFDLQRRQWVSPYGNGEFSDVLLNFGKTSAHRQFDFRTTMKVSFTNNTYAGCYQLKKDEFSDMKTVYRADSNANFNVELNYVHERRPGVPRADNRLEKDSYLVFRTRTKVDEDGKLVSAHYGMIRGGWAFFDSMISGGFIFNPTPNDTNLEDAETARRSSQMWGTPSGVAQTEPFWTSSGFASLLSVGKAWVRE